MKGLPVLTVLVMTCYPSWDRRGLHGPGPSNNSPSLVDCIELNVASCNPPNLLPSEKVVRSMEAGPNCAVLWDSGPKNPVSV